MERRFDRRSVLVPVDLVWGGKAGGFELAGGLVDVSQGGLRVYTGSPLVPGGLVRVFVQGKANPFASCRVIWTRTHGGALPSEAGLEILEQLASVPCAA